MALLELGGGGRWNSSVWILIASVAVLLLGLLNDPISSRGVGLLNQDRKVNEPLHTSFEATQVQLFGVLHSFILRRSEMNVKQATTGRADEIYFSH